MSSAFPAATKGELADSSEKLGERRSEEELFSPPNA
jgi:hypothetical protein